MWLLLFTCINDWVYYNLILIYFFNIGIGSEIFVAWCRQIKIWYIRGLGEYSSQSAPHPPLVVIYDRTLRFTLHSSLLLPLGILPKACSGEKTDRRVITVNICVQSDVQWLSQWMVCYIQFYSFVMLCRLSGKHLFKGSPTYNVRITAQSDMTKQHF